MWDCVPDGSGAVFLCSRAKATSYLLSSWSFCFVSPSLMGRFLMLIIYWLILFCSNCSFCHLKTPWHAGLAKKVEGDSLSLKLWAQWENSIQLETATMLVFFTEILYSVRTYKKSRMPQVSWISSHRKCKQLGKLFLHSYLFSLSVCVVALSLCELPWQGRPAKLSFWIALKCLWNLLSVRKAQTVPFLQLSQSSLINKIYDHTSGKKKGKRGAAMSD